MSRLEPGQEIGNYRVEGLLGRGGQGVVYRATHLRLHTPHAIKMVMAGRAGQARLLEEGRIQARLRHPNLVPVTDVVVDGEDVGIVAELVPGVGMDVWMLTTRPPIEVRVDLFRQVCAGVGHAHAAGVVHRDLKPENILVDTAGGRVTARITDFGVAKVLAAGTHTMPGLPMGTLGYMAPEQLTDASTVDGRADIFALGCLLYYLVFGNPPFAAETLDGYRAAIASGVIGPSTDGVAVGHALRHTMARCLALDPTDRPPTCEAVLLLLDESRNETYAHAPVTRALPTDRGTPTLIPTAESPRAAVVGAVLAVALVATGLWYVTSEPGATAVTGPGAPIAPVGPSPLPAGTAGTGPTIDELVSDPGEASAPPLARSPASPGPAASRFGRVTAWGDAVITSLTSGGRRFTADRVPPGHYSVAATFNDGTAVPEVATIAVHAGEHVQLHCKQRYLQCTVEKQP